MPGILWLAACVGYCIWAAKGRRASVLQGILHGLFLGLLCFGILPPAMEMPLFYGAAACSVCGAATGVWLENRMGCRGFWFTAPLFMALTLLWLWQEKTGGGIRFPFCEAFFGGIGLYAACCGVLPEDGTARDKLRPAVGGGIGFLLSAALFAVMGIF